MDRLLIAAPMVLVTGKSSIQLKQNGKCAFSRSMKVCRVLHRSMDLAKRKELGEVGAPVQLDEVWSKHGVERLKRIKERSFARM